jgi:transposase
MSTKILLGIDIAKDTIAVCILAKNAAILHADTYANTCTGHKKLWRIVKKMNADHIVTGMEATGAYWKNIAQFLHTKGAEVAVINPSWIKHFARAGGLRQKTDAVDAHVIARYIRTQEYQLWTPPSPEVQKLTAIVRRLENIASMRQKEKNRLATACDAITRRSIQRIIALYDKEYARIEKECDILFDAAPELKTNVKLLVSIPGIGKKTARDLVVYLQRTPFATARQAAAGAGVTPSHSASGTSVYKKPRISRAGDRHIRAALYEPALSAIRFNPVIKTWSEKLKERGKTTNAVRCAVMRKLIHIAWGVLHHQEPFKIMYVA